MYILLNSHCRPVHGPYSSWSFKWRDTAAECLLARDFCCFDRVFKTVRNFSISHNHTNWLSFLMIFIITCNTCVLQVLFCCSCVSLYVWWSASDWHRRCLSPVCPHWSWQPCLLWGCLQSRPVPGHISDWYHSGSKTRESWLCWCQVSHSCLCKSLLCQ